MDLRREGAGMTPAQRSRYYKTGGVVAFVFLLLWFFSGNKTAEVRDVVKGTLLELQLKQGHPLINALEGILTVIRSWRSDGIRPFGGDS